MRTAAAIAAGLLVGCSSSPWHENLMNNQQLVAANCEQLAAEQQKVADNAKHASEAASNGQVGGMILSVLSAYSGSQTNAGENTTNLASQHDKQAKEFDDRARLINTLRSSKGC